MVDVVHPDAQQPASTAANARFGDPSTRTDTRTAWTSATRIVPVIADTGINTTAGIKSTGIEYSEIEFTSIASTRIPSA